jgi:hypothetical protein
MKKVNQPPSGAAGKDFLEKKTHSAGGLADLIKKSGYKSAGGQGASRRSNPGVDRARVKIVKNDGEMNGENN